MWSINKLGLNTVGDSTYMVHITVDKFQGVYLTKISPFVICTMSSDQILLVTTQSDNCFSAS